MGWTIAGVVVGVLASLPMLYALAVSISHRGFIGIGPLIACCVIPYGVLQVFMLCINYYVHEAAAAFGFSSTISFLVCVTIAVIIGRPWR